MTNSRPIAHVREKDGEIQTVGQHLLGVAKIAKKAAAKLGLNEAGELIGLLHDLGKYSEEFQQYIQSATGVIDPDADDYVDAAGKKVKLTILRLVHKPFGRLYHSKGNCNPSPHKFWRFVSLLTIQV
ncbi:MAG: hypothetical protein RI964_2372 [Pseudomonadota bacterium]|jgi:CRISPR-associated endonuclease Cas3-HD